MSTQRKNKDQELADQIADLAKRARINGWNEFVEELKVPGELVPALTTGRVELIRMAQPRPLDAEQVGSLYRLIAGLLETNLALRQHASDIANMSKNWVGSIHGLVGVAQRIGRFADFDHSGAAEEIEEED